jgi:hypothetical protein
MTSLRWGLLSTARINRALIPAIRAGARSELVAVASRAADRAAEYARQWDIPQAFGSYEEMLADPSINAIYVSLPNHLHVEWAVRPPAQESTCCARSQWRWIRPTWIGWPRPRRPQASWSAKRSCIGTTRRHIGSWRCSTKAPSASFGWCGAASRSRSRVTTTCA